MTNIYMAGSIDNHPEDGREWRTELTNSREDVNFLNPLDLHDPRDGNYERSDIVPDDLSLLDRADGIILKYQYRTPCWGTPSEQGYALAVNRLTNDTLPVSVWWNELGWFKHETNRTNEIDDPSPWLTSDECCIGVHSDRDEALNALLEEIHSEDYDRTETAHDDPHGFLPQYVTPVSDYRGVIKR